MNGKGQLKLQRIYPSLMFAFFVIFGAVAGALYAVNSGPEELYRQGIVLQNEAAQRAGKKTDNDPDSGRRVVLNNHRKALAKFAYIEKRYPAWAKMKHSLIAAAKRNSLDWISKIKAMPELGRAVAAYRNGKFEEAEDAFGTLELKYRDSLPQLALLAESYTGYIYLKTGRLGGAVKEFSSVMRNCSGESLERLEYCGMALAGLGRAYLVSGRLAEAREKLQRLFAVYGDSPSYAIGLKMTLELLPPELWTRLSASQGKELGLIGMRYFYLDTSEKDLKKALKEENQREYFYAFKGLKLYIEGRQQEAMPYYKKYVESAKVKDEIYETAARVFGKAKGSLN